MDISNKSVAIVTHQMVYGAAHALRDYLIKKKLPRILFIAHPINEELTYSCYEYYKEGTLKKEGRISRRGGGKLFTYWIDFFISAGWLLQYKAFDLFVGVNNLNCLLGLLLKKIRRVKKVIYYSIDFTPERFRNRIINTIYHSIESYCVRKSNTIWNTSPRIATGRQKYLAIDPEKYPQEWVPIGVVWDGKLPIPYSSVNNHQVIFVGHILEKQGIQEVIRAFPLVLGRIPDAIFIVVGGGPYLSALKTLTSSLNLNSSVSFKGWITDRKELNGIMQKSAISVATYSKEGKESSNFSYYADPTKIKEYLNAGLPVIMTDVPYISHELVLKKCGIVVRYDNRAIATAIITLLGNDEKIKIYRQNAKKFAQKSDWKIIFDRSFKNLS